MSTFTDHKIIRQIIARNGEPLPGELPEPPVVRIVQYTNAWGGQCWGVVYADDRNPYRYDEPSEHVFNPHVIFTRPDLLSGAPPGGYGTPR